MGRAPGIRSSLIWTPSSITFGQGTGPADVQEGLRFPPAVGLRRLAERDRRTHGRAAQVGQCRLQHRRRSRDRHQGCAQAGARDQPRQAGQEGRSVLTRPGGSKRNYSASSPGADCRTRSASRCRWHPELYHLVPGTRGRMPTTPTARSATAQPWSSSPDLLTAKDLLKGLPHRDGDRAGQRPPGAQLLMTSMATGSPPSSPARGQLAVGDAAPPPRHCEDRIRTAKTPA